jgi:P27 family predicted phage terminase small subunit
MGRRGPAPKPSGLRLLEGTDRRGHSGRRLDRSKEPIAPDDELVPPYELAAEVRQVWDQTVADLEAMGVASSADVNQVAIYAEAVVLHRAASRLIAQSSILMVGARGTLVINKAVLVQRQASLVALRLAQEFGLTPAARTSIDVDATPVRQPAGRKPNPFAG